MSEQVCAIIVLPRLRIQNANIISSPITWGFPSVTAVLGFMHALERKMRSVSNLRFTAVGIVSHRFQPQVYGQYEKRFSLTRNPIKKDGGSPSLVEEGRGHLEISLILKGEGEAFNAGEADLKKLASAIEQTAQTLRFAGGSILPTMNQGWRYQPVVEQWANDSDSRVKTTKKLRRLIMPGFSLINREDLLLETTQVLKEKNLQATHFDSLLECIAIHHQPIITTSEDVEKVTWQIRKKQGWIVPITIGYQAISPLYEAGSVENVRDTTVPVRFVENIYSLGEWLSPHRVDNLEQLFWRFDYQQTENGIYRCINQFK
jgi:CRISPR-associated protein Csy2